jgi:hypothetical protein
MHLTLLNDGGIGLSFDGRGEERGEVVEERE